MSQANVPLPIPCRKVIIYVLIDEAALAQLPVDDDITLPSITLDTDQEPTVSEETALRSPTLHIFQVRSFP